MLKSYGFLVANKEEAYKEFHGIPRGRLEIHTFHGARVRSEIMRQVAECNVTRRLNLSYDFA